MFFVRQTWSKSAEINHEGREAHKEFATDRVTCRTSKIEATDISLISVRLFTYIAACLRLMMDRRRMRLVKVLNTAPLHFPPRTGVWYWKRKVQPRQRKRRWKSSAEPTGGHFMGSFDAKATSPRKHRISLKLFSRGCSSGRTSKL